MTPPAERRARRPPQTDVAAAVSDVPLPDRNPKPPALLAPPGAAARVYRRRRRRKS